MKPRFPALPDPPRIAPVPADVVRPLWSVMIPTYNCANYLRQTLESVLAQDPGPDEMQIEVVDDRSTKDDPEAVVRELGTGRVGFYRKARNEGATANFNTCIERSRGQLVHILHGDDWVLPGFYQRIKAAAQQFEACALYSTRCFFADEAGHFTFVSRRVPELETAPARDARSFYYVIPVQFASIVVRRSFYEAEGMFNPGIIHTADWEMWSRAVTAGGGMILPEVLAAYRIFSSNETGRLARTGENLIHRQRMIGILASRHSDFDARGASRQLWDIAVEQERRFRQLGDPEASAANRRFWTTHASFRFRARQALQALRGKIGT